MDEDLNQIDIFVYCGGKCGSSTLHTTFKHNGFKSYHTHTNYYFQHVLKPNFSKTIFDVIDFNAKTKPIYIVDSYRTPIERKMSSFFQNITKYVPHYAELTIHELIHYFNTNLLHKIEEYHSIDEVMHHYGLNPFTTFDFEKKYNIIQKDNLIFVKIRFNDIQEWPSILSTIVNSPIVLHNHNLTNTKPIHKLYAQFKDNYCLPEKYLNQLLKDAQFNIYNSEEEKEKYIHYWKTKLARE